MVFIIQHPGHDPREREDEDEKKKLEQELKLKKLLKENEELQKEIAEVVSKEREVRSGNNVLFCAERQKNRPSEETYCHEERAGETQDGDRKRSEGRRELQWNLQVPSPHTTSTAIQTFFNSLMRFRMGLKFVLVLVG